MTMRWAARAGWLLSATAALAQVMPAAFAADLRTGPWGGSYDCSQGSTPAFLTLDRIEPSAAQSRVFATFKFGGGALPSGSYTLQGSYDPRTRELALKPVAWISRPGNYVAVGFNGAINEELTRFSGKMDFHLCGAIRLMSLTRHPTASPSANTAAAIPSSPAAPSPASPPPVATTAAQPTPEATTAPGASTYSIRNPPTVDQFRKLSEEDRAAYRLTVRALTREQYVALPFDVQLRAAELMKADAVLSMHAASKAISDLEKAALVDPGFGATPAERQSALDQVKDALNRWMKQHPKDDPDDEFIVFLKTQTGFTRPQMVAAVKLRGARQALLGASEAIELAQRSYDILISTREKEKALQR